MLWLIIWPSFWCYSLSPPPVFLCCCAYCVCFQLCFLQIREQNKRLFVILDFLVNMSLTSFWNEVTHKSPPLRGRGWSIVGVGMNMKYSGNFNWLKCLSGRQKMEALSGWAAVDALSSELVLFLKLAVIYRPKPRGNQAFVQLGEPCKLLI